MTDGSVHSPLANISLTSGQIVPLTLPSPLYITKGCTLFVDHISGAFDVRVAYHTVSQAGQ